MSNSSVQDNATATLSPDRRDVPTALQLSLVDAGHKVGWVAGDVVGFRGFAGEVEAAHAAWVAHRAIASRLARRSGEWPVPIDTEPLAMQRGDDGDVILASSRPIGTLLRPGPDSLSGPDSFGFEIRSPHPTDELGMRAKAYLAYRTLRKSGVRWALWRPGGLTPTLSPPSA
ncbi:MAG: hypothetical protein ACT4PJ_08160 [Gemmatimonadaceae bacterium]